MSPITKDDVARLYGRRLVLIDDKVIEKLQFGKDGYVVATVGERDDDKGPVICCPLWRWSLTKAGHLRIYEEKQLLWVLWAVPDRICAEWTSLSLRDNALVVETLSGPRSYTLEA